MEIGRDSDCVINVEHEIAPYMEVLGDVLEDMRYLVMCIGTVDTCDDCKTTVEDVLFDMHQFAERVYGHKIGPYPVANPRWDGVGQLFYSINMIWRGVDSGWKLMGETALAIRKTLDK
jgi:hypothetical protein